MLASPELTGSSILSVVLASDEPVNSQRSQNFLRSKRSDRTNFDPSVASSLGEASDLHHGIIRIRNEPTGQVRVACENSPETAIERTEGVGNE